ncbi:MAG: prolipoprotein diacylglyceryl transferase [Patescibacteria group bacterium]|nr:prolipoprotein diacylglyceryl transferase [Patescibacteria group bacterium]
MLNFLHNFEPNSVMISWGFLKIYWYGFFIVLGMFLAFSLSLFLAKKYRIKKDTIIDLAFYLIIFGIIGARIYDIFLEWRYYIKNPIDAFKIWQGGLAIHGAILAGLITLWFFVKRVKIDSFKNFNQWTKFFKLTAIITPGLALAQAIGRWGNYFNQELFGRPTDLPWGIYISPGNRPFTYLNNSFFHPTFLYESLGNFIIFLILISIHLLIIKKNKVNFKNDFLITSLYLFLYSILRFSLEFIRIDFAPEIFGLRFPQFVSIIIVIVIIISFPKVYFKK